MHLQELIIYTTLSNDPLINKYISFIEASNLAEIRKAYFDLVKGLISVEMPFEAYLYTKMIEVDNSVLERLSHENYDINALDKACLKNDLGILNNIINSNIDTKINDVDDKQNILGHLVANTPSSITLNAYKSYYFY